MGLFFRGRKNASINDLAPILAQIIVDILRGKQDTYHGTIASMSKLISSRVSGTEFELSEGYINRLADMLYNTLTAVERSELLRAVYMESRWFSKGEKVQGKLGNIFSSIEDFEFKFHQNIAEIIKAQMGTVDL